MNKLTTLVYLAGLIAFAPTAAHAVQYQIVDLGIGIARATNDSGQIAGDSFITGQGYVACLWQSGVKTDLGTLGTALISINNNGQIAGQTTESGNNFCNAVLWQNGVMTNLVTFGGTWSGADGINNNGQIVGWGDTSSGTGRAVLWQNGSVTDLGTLARGFGGCANGINNKGQIVGWGDTLNQQTQNYQTDAFLWQNGSMTDLGTLGVSMAE